MPKSSRPAPLAIDVLARRTTLPRKLAAVTLTGRLVRLEPLDLDGDIEALFAVTSGQPFTLGERRVEAYDSDERVWRFMSAGPFESAEDMRPYLRRLLDAADALPLTVFDIASGCQIGIACFLANSPEHLKIEIGAITYGLVAQRTGANSEATYLMARHVFALGYRRLEWKCDARNLASRRAAEKMGFIFEGIQEAHFIIKGCNRDTAWYRILDHEWPTAKDRLEERLYGDHQL